MTESDELNAIDATLQGDIAAFEQLVAAHQSKVIRLAHGITGDADRARDISQDSFVAAFRQLASYDPHRAAFATWLLTITRNLAIKADRRYKRGHSPIANEVPAEAQESGPAESLAWKETFTTLDEAMLALPPRWRAAFTLTEIDGLSYEEAARVEGIPVGTVRSRVFRSRKRLREALAASESSQSADHSTEHKHAT